MKKINNSQGNTLITVLVIIAILVGSYFIVMKLVLPSVINKTINTAVNIADDLNFDNAKSIAIDQDLSQKEGMFLQIVINKGEVVIDGTTQTDAIKGEVKYLGEKPTITYPTTENKAAIFKIQSIGEAGDQATLHLTPLTNGKIEIALGGGSAKIDLRGLDIPFLNVAAGAGVVDIIFSEKASTEANLAAGVGKLNLSVPKGIGVKVTFAQAVSSDVKFGDAYVKVDNSYQTKNYNQATVKANINIGQAVGGFNIQEIE